MNVDAPVFGQTSAEASWLEPRLTGDPGTVTGTVPAGFAAYARILHPVEGDDQDRTWSAIAAEAGTTIHPTVQWHRLINANIHDTDQSWHGSAPDDGNLVPSALRSLLDVLERHTATPDNCWFCLWNGYGWWNGTVRPTWATSTTQAKAARGDLVRLPHREYVLGRGPLRGALRIGSQLDTDWWIPQSPNIFWPNDRAWCVASEIDFDSTLVGGSQELIDALVNSSQLEALVIRSDGALHYQADQIN